MVLSTISDVLCHLAVILPTISEGDQADPQLPKTGLAMGVNLEHKYGIVHGMGLVDSSHVQHKAHCTGFFSSDSNTLILKILWKLPYKMKNLQKVI